MTPEQQAQACQRFWRGDSTGDGTGLGLAIVAQLVRASGGDLTFLDAPGGGLDVVIRLNRAPARQSPRTDPLRDAVGAGAALG
jgi:signal transduction histidine kinase